ncbi:YggS family pyridoxal phosphate-dependent enzyme [Coraliomargarita sp. SDUM461004]|uniref:Pyridoxal phosphate homeostasis protein n=1 Tax=Thalassobacterium sedimentorum TaxID=3041258 RepID=A0ABU1AIM8_9BACT|nr:YggS family pyridoxal phosphate-dependent enzyme [Coraliomargarita sp. SDUM461004]MDQ8194672.1 YggS family pyridoxal phosphate-dependent enzyme [Coraliomargarita sp. SDUM461004]
MIEYSIFEKNLSQVRARIALACESCGRASDTVSLLPVTKNHPVAAVDYALRSGLLAVGENRVQEAADKQGSCLQPVSWELIGHLQSNKAQDAVAIFDRIQSVDSLKLLRRLNRIAGEQGKLLRILLQCNTGEDPNKFGFLVSQAEEVLEAGLEAAHLEVEGLMTIAPLDEDPTVASAAFQRLRDLRDELAGSFGVPLSELSMGMTGDLEAAIAAGSTQIRVGTALYGQRAYL